MNNKRLLQTAICVGCLVPITAGIFGAVGGITNFGAEEMDLDSHFRYLSGLLLAIGLGFLSTVQNIERQTARFRLLTLIVATGGFFRLSGLFLVGIPGSSMIAALIMELIVTPALCYWQSRVSVD